MSDLLKRLLALLHNNRSLVGIVVAALLGAGVTVVVSTIDENGNPKTTTVHVGGTVTAKVDGADPNRKLDQTLKVPATDVAVAKATMEYSPENLHGPSPKTEVLPPLHVSAWKRAL